MVHCSGSTPFSMPVSALFDQASRHTCVAAGGRHAWKKNSRSISPSFAELELTTRERSSSRTCMMGRTPRASSCESSGRARMTTLTLLPIVTPFAAATHLPQTTGTRHAAELLDMMETLVQKRERNKAGVYCSNAPKRTLWKVLQGIRGINSWQAFYNPPWPYRIDGNVTTIASALLRRGPTVNYRRHNVPTRDGGQVSLDEVKGEGKGLWGARDVLIIMSGLGGSSNDSYVRRMASLAASKGFGVGVVNFRGCAGTELKTPKFFSARRGAVEDLKDARDFIRENHHGDPGIFAIAYSNGASVLAHFLADQSSSRHGSLPSSRLDAGSADG